RWSARLARAARPVCGSRPYARRMLSLLSGVPSVERMEGLRLKYFPERSAMVVVWTKRASTSAKAPAMARRAAALPETLQGRTPCASWHGRTSPACAVLSRDRPLGGCLIVAAGRFDPVETARAVAADREPRLDVYELCRALSAEVLDFKDLDAAASPMVRAVRRALGDSAALALLGASRAGEFRSVLTTGEDIGIPLAARLRFA